MMKSPVIRHGSCPIGCRVSASHDQCQPVTGDGLTHGTNWQITCGKRKRQINTAVIHLCKKLKSIALNAHVNARCLPRQPGHDGGFKALARGKSVSLIVHPDTQHDFAYVPDIGRAVVTLLDAPDDAFGQVWHMPCAPTRTPREILGLGASFLGVKPKISALPVWVLPMIGVFIPTLREFREMRFQLDRPYHVDSRKFAKRFWSDVTSFETGAQATAASFTQ